MVNLYHVESHIYLINNTYTLKLKKIMIKRDINQIEVFNNLSFKRELWNLDFSFWMRICRSKVKHLVGPKYNFFFFIHINMFCLLFFGKNKYFKITLILHTWLKETVLGRTCGANTFPTRNWLLDQIRFRRPFFRFSIVSQNYGDDSPLLNLYFKRMLFYVRRLVSIFFEVATLSMFFW